MKRLFFAMLMASLAFCSCDKVLNRPNDDSSSSSSTDDHGGNSGGGGGTNIAASAVPAAVMTAFKSQFPSATNIEWKKLDNGNFKAQFYIAAVKWEVIYSPAGVQLKLDRS